MLALGDALAMAAMEARDFTHEDYARHHPAGSLGRRLTLRVSDVMRSGDEMAVIGPGKTLLDAMFAINKAGAGAAFLVDGAGLLAGLITDGDIRRIISEDRGALDSPCEKLVTRKPLVVIVGDPLAAEALQILEEAPKKVGEAPVIDGDGRPVGLIMLKDLLRAGL
jgi:arabinose-5-phosphate isomerase